MIYYLSKQQRYIAEDTAADINASRLWPDRVVTEIEPAGPFWEAEPEHSGLPRAYTEWLHLPFHPPELNPPRACTNRQSNG